MKRKPRYNFMLSQLYLKQDQGVNAMAALKKAIRFNFNYEMVFNAKVNMALAYQGEDAVIEKQLKKMLKDSRNDDFQDRIYYALGTIEEKRGEEKKAVDLYWKSVRASVDNDNQQALSFRKLGDHYFKVRNYVQAQCCYDSCMYTIDSRYEDYDKLKALLGDLTDLTQCLGDIQLLDSLLRLAAMPEVERNKIIDHKIQEIRDKEAEEREEARQAMSERNFYERNNMLGNRGTNATGSNGSDWYFYNPVTIATGKNEFKRKWGRRKLEDNWRRQNKAMVDFSEDQELLVDENGEGGKGEEKDVKSREYYLQGLPMTEESKRIAVKKMGNAYYRAGELYLYKFNDPAKAMECFDAYIQRFDDENNLPMLYYLACKAAKESDNSNAFEKYSKELLQRFPKSDFALGLQDPEYFKEVGNVLKTVEGLYGQAYARYEQVYYKEAEEICDEILKKYPDNKLKVNVLFLKAMCMLNTSSAQESKKVLEEVLNNAPSAEMRTVVGDILASMSTGNEPVTYSGGDMAQARYLRANRNWTFDKELQLDETDREMSTYQLAKDQEQVVVIVLKDGFNLAEEMRFKARLTFIHASEAAEGKHYELSKEELWYKQDALIIRKFENSHKASIYFSRVATDKYLLKIIGDRSYRMFIMANRNLERFKRLKEVDSYTEFFIENYFVDRQRGEMLCGKHGAPAPVFNFEA
ncbi:MAG: tetratricopeptide repeat protein [Odoribacter sp.]|nr:tetratricopeptide repeat protein [Odoribacter sp.]